MTDISNKPLNLTPAERQELNEISAELEKLAMRGKALIRGARERYPQTYSHAKLVDRRKH